MIYRSLGRVKKVKKKKKTLDFSLLIKSKISESSLFEIFLLGHFFHTSYTKEEKMLKQLKK